MVDDESTRTKREQIDSNTSPIDSADFVRLFRNKFLTLVGVQSANFCDSQNGTVVAGVIQSHHSLKFSITLCSFFHYNYVKETNRTRSISRDKNIEKNTKTPFFPNLVPITNKSNKEQRAFTH